MRDEPAVIFSFVGADDEAVREYLNDILAAGEYRNVLHLAALAPLSATGDRGTRTELAFQRPPPPLQVPASYQRFRQTGFISELLEIAWVIFLTSMATVVLGGRDLKTPQMADTAADVITSRLKSLSPSMRSACPFATRCWTFRCFELFS